MADKRVIEQTASTEIYGDDYFLKDSALNGTTKIAQVKLKQLIGVDGTNALADITNAIADEYDTSTSYAVGDFAFYNNKLYICTTATTGAWDGSDWSEVNLLDLIEGAGQVKDVKVNGTSVVDANQIAQIKSYKEVTQAQYDALPSSKNSDGIMYCITDGEVNIVNDVTLDGTSVVDDGVAELSSPNVDDVKVDGVSVVDENKIAQITTPDADGISYDNTTSGLEADDVQEAIDEVVTDIESVETALETKAEVDGFYDELYAGNLLSDNTETDNAPYTYRPSPSGKSCVDLSVVGGTVAWNQLYNVTQTTTQRDVKVEVNNGIINISGTSTDIGTGPTFAWTNFKIPTGHKVIVLKDFSLPTGDYIFDQYNRDSSTDIIGRITNISSGGYLIPQLRVTNTNVTYNVTNGHLSVIDLTQAFGSAIADYLYTIDTAEAGSGIAWLKSYGYLIKDYYAYQSGKLESVNVASRKVVGFNQFDKSTITPKAYINDSTGALITSVASWSDVLNASDWIKVIPNTIYYHNMGGQTSADYLAWYDADKNYISGQGSHSSSTITSPLNAHYLRITIHNDYIDSCCINISDPSKNGTYEPYKSKTYPLDSDLTLRGIVKKDANNNLYYDGDTYESDGSVKRKFGVVDLGTLDWTRILTSDNSYKFGTDNLNPYHIITYVIPNAICSKGYTPKPFAGYSATPIDNLSFVFHASAGNTIYIRDDTYSTAEAFKTAMNGVYLVYELATPTTETAQPYTNPQLVGSTEEFVDAGTSASTPTRDVDIPVGQDSKYHTDLKAKLEELAKIPDVPSTNGTYTLKATRSASGVEYNWVSG